MHDELVERRHALAHLFLPGDEPHVARGQQPFQLARAVDDDESANAGVLHHAAGVGEAVCRLDGIRIGNHAVLGALDDLHLAHLCCDVAAAEAAIDDAEAPFFSLDHSHRGPRDGVHVRRDNRMLQRDVLGEAGGEINRFRIAALEDAEPRREQKIIKGAAANGGQEIRHAAIIA